ncbi:MAG TPA: MarR family transcriptional regulator [Candidatus Angelobacter sp.]|jgi:DNA-binding MarR family transcriptional regulator|nr:MarR family transcriptional regulator [Candidatus Angelobacter sp.]
MSRTHRAAVEAAMAAVGELVAERRRSSMAWVRGCDVSMAQLHVLATLHEQGDMTVGALAEALSISAPSASAVVDRLVERDLVRRERSADDRRIVRLSLSDAGRRFTEQVHGLGAENFRRILAELSDDDLGDLVRVTLRLRDASAAVADREQRDDPPAAAAG